MKAAFLLLIASLAPLAGAGVDLDLGELVGQEFGRGGLAHPQHEQVVEVADDLTGLRAGADLGLDVAHGLGIAAVTCTPAPPALLTMGMNSSPISSLNSSACRLMRTLPPASEPGRPSSTPCL